MDETAQIARGGFYNHDNPPLSTDIAQTRLYEIERVIEDISVQLDHTRADEFETDEDFFVWKSRAMKAAGHYRSESRYLERWMKEQTRTRTSDETKSDVQHITSSQHQMALRRVSEEVQRVTLRVQKLYKRTYVEGHLPADIQVAQVRRKLLRDLELEFRACFMSLRNEAHAFGVGAKKLAELRRPISKLHEELKSEIQLLTNFIDENRGGRVDWVMFLLSLIERAVDGGFLITDSEREVLEEIRDYKLAEIASTEAEAV